jgi:hypothetical protein
MASGLVRRANRPNTWLHRPACKREEKPCQLGAVHTWHKADFRRGPLWCPLLGAKRTKRDGHHSFLPNVVLEKFGRVACQGRDTWRPMTETYYLSGRFSF